VRRLAIALLLGSLVLASCGLSENDHPEAIPPENVPPGLLDADPSTTTTGMASGEGSTVTVYLVERSEDGTKLTGVHRMVANSSNPGDRITALLSQPTEEETARGLTTAIPADTVLLHSAVEEDDQRILDIDVSSELFDVQGEELATAFAQFVWTVSQLSSVREVRFLVDGEPINAQDAEGVEQDGPVSTADYVDLAPDG
jgi:spore germination protein GerM